MLDHANDDLEDNFRVHGYIFFHEDNIKKNKYCEISHFSIANPASLVEKMVQTTFCSAAEYNRICRDMTEVKRKLNQWLKSRSETFEKKGTREYEFKSHEISFSALLRLIPAQLWNHLKVERREWKYLWTIPEVILLHPSFQTFLEFPCKTSPQLQDNLTQMFVSSPLVVSTRNGNFVWSVGGIGSVGGTPSRILWERYKCQTPCPPEA